MYVYLNSLLHPQQAASTTPRTEPGVWQSLYPLCTFPMCTSITCLLKCVLLYTFPFQCVCLCSRLMFFISDVMPWWSSCLWPSCLTRFLAFFEAWPTEGVKIWPLVTSDSVYFDDVTPCWSSCLWSSCLTPCFWRFLKHDLPRGEYLTSCDLWWCFFDDVNLYCVYI